MSNVTEMGSPQINPGVDPNTMSIIVTKGSLDWAYPPFILFGSYDVFHFLWASPVNEGFEPPGKFIG